MTTLLAVSRWATTPAAEAKILAPLLGMAVYDLLLRLNGPLPVVVAADLAEDAARQMLYGLRGRNNGAVLIDPARLVSTAGLYVPKTFTSDASSFVANAPGREPLSVSFSEIVALLRAKGSVESATSTISQKKKFSAAKAVMTGGLLRSKTVTSEDNQVTGEQEQHLYVMTHSPSRSLLLQESHLRYQGLGHQTQKTTAENFRILLELFRHRAPQALYDERLFKHKRKRELVSLTGTTANSTAIQSNLSTNFLAVQIIVAAIGENQL